MRVIEEDEIQDAIESELNRRAADAVTWVMCWTFTPEGIEPITAYRRFVALVYVLRPDLLGGRTMRELAASLGESKTGFERKVVEVRERIEFDGLLARPNARKVTSVTGEKDKISAEEDV